MFEWSGFDKEEHPAEMWDLLQQGFTAGIFQVEDGYGRQLCKRMEPRNVEDLAVIVALNRPGPIQAGIPDQYIARRQGIEPVTYAHPRLEELLAPILGPTHGLFVYQEQIIAYFNALDYTLSESDAMRKIMGKKTPEQLDAIRDGLEEWEGRGYFRMARAAGLPDDVAEHVWKELEGFADYCFNKSHAVAYAIIGFRTLCAKYYGPSQSYAASIRSLDPSRDGEKRKTMVPEYVNECRRLNIEVCPPDIRYAKGYAHVAYDGRLFFGFGDIQSVGHSGDYICDLRDHSGLNIDTPETLRADFDAENQAFLKLKKEKVETGEWDPKVKSPKQQLQANKIDALEKAGAWDDMGWRDLTLTERQQCEADMLGVVLTDNWTEVQDRNGEEIAQCDAWSDLLIPWEAKMAKHESPEEVEFIEYKVCGIVVGVGEKRSKKSGNPFGLVTIEYGHDTVEFTVFSTRWARFKRSFKMRTPGIFTLHHTPPTEYGESYLLERAHILK